MKILVLVEDYPSLSSHSMMYVHVRNQYYKKNNIDVTVLSFRAKKNYKYEGINVITLNTYQEKTKNFDILICHAPNIKHHYIFLKKNQKKFNKIIFFFHGHEILKINETYPQKYEWIKNKNNKLIRGIYDNIKIILWRKEIKKLLSKSHLIFVSKWLYDRFLYYIHINPQKIDNHVSIINNSVGEIFEKENYDIDSKKEYDFITIRGSALDRSEHAIDIVTKLAEINPNNTFLVIGNGNFYNYNKIPPNLTFMNKILTHEQMIEYLNLSKCALLPTRHDTQGVSTCEMITFGIPTITSRIEVCKEIFDNIDNIKFIENDNLEEVNLDNILMELRSALPYKKTERYFAKNTIQKEIEIMQ